MTERTEEATPGSPIASGAPDPLDPPTAAMPVAAMVPEAAGAAGGARTAGVAADARPAERRRRGKPADAPDPAVAPGLPPGEPSRVFLHGDPPGPIVPHDPPAAAARKVMWLHVGRLLDRELEIRDPDKADALRKYRVATRRLRSALRIFGFALPDAPTERFRRGLGELGEAVGLVRDADVRIANATAFGADLEAGPEALAPLVEAWRSDRNRAYARLIARLETKRHRRWLERLAAFVEEPSSPSVMSGGRPPATVRGRAAAHVWDAYERVRAYTEIVRWADFATLHQLRTETKRCRYTLEFLADILGPERPWLVERLTALQDHLGAINDAAVTATAIRSFLEARSGAIEPAQRAAIAEYLADREREVGRLRRAIGRAWRPVVSVTFIRRLGRVVVIA